MPRKLGTAEVTDETFRVSVSGKRCHRSSHRYKKLSEPKGITALFCCPKGKVEKGKCQEPLIMKTVVYDRDKWTKKQAEKHAQKRFT